MSNGEPMEISGGSVAREQEMIVAVPPYVVGEINAPAYAHADGFEHHGRKRRLPGTIVPAITLPLDEQDDYLDVAVLDITAGHEVQSTIVELAIHDSDRNILIVDSDDHQHRILGGAFGNATADIAGPLGDDGEMIRFRLSSPVLPGLNAPHGDAPPAASAPFSGRDGYVAPVEALRDRRLPREVWLELRHRNAQRALLATDTARITIAPFIVSSDIDPPIRLYVFYIIDKEEEGEEEDDDDEPQVLVDPGNFGFVRDLMRIAALAGASVETWDFYPPDGPFVIGRGVFVQDHHLFGYTTTPNFQNQVVYYVTTMPHDGAPDVLAPYRLGDRPAQGFRPALNGAGDSINFGGNIVASPPVARATDEILQAGTHPRIRAHPAAPYGKLVIGASTARGPSAALARFLKNQAVQPIVPIDTTWLEVAHADEVVSFATCPDHGGRPIMLLAVPDLAVNLLYQLTVILGYGAPLDRPARGSDSDMLAHFMPRFNRSPQQLLAALGDIDLVMEDVVHDTSQGELEVQVASLPRNGTMAYMAKLDIIQARLMQVLDFDMADVVAMPVLFGPGPNNVAALLPNTVNFQLLGPHMIIPKPWGPRVGVNRAISVLVRAGVPDDLVTGFDLQPLRTEEMWLSPQQTVADLAHAMGIHEDRIAIIEHAGAPGGGWAPFRSQPSNAQRDWPAGWRKVRIAHDGVCIFEAYISVMLQGSGLTLHFVDDFRTYHRSGAGGSLGGGEIHCGTNVARLAPQVAAENAWWLNYEDYLSVDPAAI